MRRCGRFDPELAAHFALRGLAAAHRFRDQFVGQYQPCFGNVFHHKRNIRILVGACVIPMQPHRVAFDAVQRATEPLAALMRDRHLDLDEVAAKTLEI